MSSRAIQPNNDSGYANDKLEHVKALLREYRSLSDQPLVMEELRGLVHPSSLLEDITGRALEVPRRGDQRHNRNRRDPQNGGLHS